VKWVNDGKLGIGPFCTAQGVLQQFGETGVALTTLLIAVFTFIRIWWSKDIRLLRTAEFIIGLVWFFILLLVAIPNLTHRNKHLLYEVPTPYWCWLGKGYLGFRLAGEYIWLWLALLVSLLTYIPLALFFWGHRSYSVTMIAYPVVYSILVLPLSVVRWVQFVEERGGKSSDIAPSATIAAVSIFGLSGAMNVVLLVVTRPNSLLFKFGRTPTNNPDANGRLPSPYASREMVNFDDNANALEFDRPASLPDMVGDMPRSTRTSRGTQTDSGCATLP